MNKIYYFMLIFVSLTISCFANSDNPENVDSNQQTEYLSPDEIAQDDFYKIEEHSIRYSECINDKSRSEINNYNDPRHVVDAAMKFCAYALEELDHWMIERKLPPPIRHKFIRRIS
ncbi:MAG: hypothetical protein V3U02_08420, partial [Calditrichia bacterium]